MPQPAYLTRSLTLREMLAMADVSYCWRGIFAGVARCRSRGVYGKPRARQADTPGQENGLLMGARWCAKHRHDDDVKIGE